MQASGGGAGGAEGRDDQQSSRIPACQSGSGSAEGEAVRRAPQGRGGPGRGRAVMEAAVARPQGEQAPGGVGSAGDVAPLAVRPRRGEVVLTLRVPFQSPLEADMARRSLLPDAQRHQGLIRKEFAVNGSDLLVRWTADDLAFIRLSMNPFLDQLSLVIRNIRSLGLPPRQSRS
ncbi:EKC/KEOPS complex subunit LAGE3-like [Bos javanicus]|uniref:L antigen family member 3 n=1 Tax=Bos mutus grunniens TaxID=30521 RepID=A0A8B9YSB5_BOSMU|nr:EKC/KEOPS complex subunit LAGE3-like [Bos javanicus]XP_061265051.1 EKC/KEOPS complex subunit LAGE3-like [Bos javanicus]